MTFEATPADDFVEHIGVNTHLNYLDTNYANQSMVADILVDIGIRHIRDNCYSWKYFPPNWPTSVDVLTIVDSRTNGQLEFGQLSTMLNASSFQPRLAGLEGPNEYDVAGLDSVTWPLMLSLWQQGLWTLKNKGVNSSVLSPVPTIAPSMALGPQHATPICASECTTQYCDYANMHSYPGGHMPTAGLQGNIFNNSLVVAGAGKMTWATETGYHTAVNFRGSEQQGVDERTHGVYMPRLFFSYWNTGLVHRTYSYELLDQKPSPNFTDSESCYGLVRFDYTYKPAASHIKNMISLLQEKNYPTFTPGSISLDISALPPSALPKSMPGGAGVGPVVLQKSNGRVYISLWQETDGYNITTQTPIPIAPVPTSIGLPDNGSGWAVANLYSLNSTIPMAVFSPLPTNGYVPFTLSDEVTLIELVPAAM
jgi:hypothetical protein